MTTRPEHARWKKWESLFTCSPHDAAYFDGELQDLQIEAACVLEIGFGRDDFVAWASQRGAGELVVSEVDPYLVEAAIERGLELLPATFETIASEHTARFDTVVAFDVFEHSTLDEITTHLEGLDTMIRPGGHLRMRFPNGQSPFGLAHQTGDPTHKTALSRDVLELLMQGTNFEQVRYGPMWLHHQTLVSHLPNRKGRVGAVNAGIDGPSDLTE